MRFQIIVPPTISTEGKVHAHPPYGAMYIASSLLEEGHEARIENGDIEKFDYAQLCDRIKKYSPDIIGFSAPVSTFYAYVKGASSFIKNQFPNLKIVLGGGLTAAVETVLNNTKVDIIVAGEGDITIKELVTRIERKESYHDINGLVFREGENIVKTQKRIPIRNLDILKYPAFDLIDMDKYLIDVRDFVTRFPCYKTPDKRLFEPHRSKKMLRIPISRGCINACSFCSRHMRGLRHFSFKYIFDYIEYLMEKFGVNIFSFGDECFAPNKAWNWKFLEELEKRKLDIMFQILGTKVETVDYDILRAYKKAGCFFIEYGFESGSQRMLDIMEKRTMVKLNIEAAKWTKEAGIFTMPAFVFGMPGETTETIKETINLLKEINYGSGWYQYTYAFPVPGTPLYDYAKVSGLITDDDEYLESIFNVKPNDYIYTKTFINFTSEPFDVVIGWPKLIDDALLKYYSHNKAIYFLKRYSKAMYNSLMNEGIKRTLFKILNFIIRFKKRLIPKSPIIKQQSLERNKYLDYSHKLMAEKKQGLTLRQIIRYMQEESSAGKTAK